MDPELKQALNDSAVALLEWAQNAGSFVTEQAPLVAQEYVAWVFWENLIFAIVLGVIALGWALVARKVFTTYEGMEIDRNSFTVAASMIALSFAISAAYQFTDAMQAHIAPRVVIVEWLQGQIK